MQQDQTPPEEGDVVEKPRKGATGRGLKRVREPNKPSKFAVVLHNDDYTPMEFVVELIEQFFYKSRENATQIMLKIHTEGKGVCGVYTPQHFACIIISTGLDNKNLRPKTRPPNPPKILRRGIFRHQD